MTMQYLRELNKFLSLLRTKKIVPVECNATKEKVLKHFQRSLTRETKEKTRFPLKRFKSNKMRLDEMRKSKGERLQDPSEPTTPYSVSLSSEAYLSVNDFETKNTKLTGFAKSFNFS